MALNIIHSVWFHWPALAVLGLEARYAIINE